MIITLIRMTKHHLIISRSQHHFEHVFVCLCLCRYSDGTATAQMHTIIHFRCALQLALSFCMFRSELACHKNE